MKIQQRTFSLVGAAFLMATGIFAQDVKTDYDRAADFNLYRTYSWGKVQTQDALWVDRIKAAVNSALAAKGWKQVESGGNVSVMAMEMTRSHQTLNTYYDSFGGGWGYGALFVRVGVTSGVAAMAFMIFPTGDGQGRMVAEHQPVTLAAMEGLFENANGAPLALVGQPDMNSLKLDNPIEVPDMLSFLTYRRWNAEVKGLKAFSRDVWPDNIPLLYYSYHIMVGLGTIMAAVMGIAALLLWRGRLWRNSPLLWALMLAIPFPYIATTAGWMTAELGRQPWLIYGLMRTLEGASPRVSAGNALFSLLGFMGIYMMLGILFLFVVVREIARGPGPVRQEVAIGARPVIVEGGTR